MSNISRIADRLRLLRFRHKLTQKEAAALVGMSPRFIQLIESGKKRQIWLETVERIAALFGIEVWQLLAPDPPTDTHLKSAPTQSTARHRRKGPYRKRARRPESPSGPGQAS